MCGICGFIDVRQRNTRTEADQILFAMTEAIKSRGPDGAGTWSDADGKVWLGHRRLSVIDLSPAGYQPMVSADGSLVVTYNGEIYNFKEIRTELERKGHTFRGQSDTEVLVEACRVWGPIEAAKRFNGIFAFALWDNAAQEFFLIRDQMGVKPLYWGVHDGLLLFGSQLKALLAHPRQLRQVDQSSVATYFQRGYVPAPFTVFKNVYKLPAGTALHWNLREEPKQIQYWDLARIARDGARNPIALSESENVAQLQSLLQDAIGKQMVSDVPLGAFLSGGIDSSTIVALMQAQSSRPVRTFSIGFSDHQFDEAPYARAVARCLKTEHTELYVEASDALTLIPKLSEWFDEPFADQSGIPTYLVSQLARRQVTVALSGDGGDELFGGYPHYLRTQRVWNSIGRLPRVARHLSADLIRAVHPERWTELFGRLPLGFAAEAGDKLYKIADLLDVSSADEVYQLFVTHSWGNAGSIVKNAHERGMEASRTRIEGETLNLLARMQLMDSLVYLPDDILVKVDRASMALGLEARVPFLDPQIIRFAWNLPEAMKIRSGKGKWILRQLLHKFLPKQMIDRPKKGFAVPLASWLRGPLREWGEDLLAEQRLRDDGLLDTALIRRYWDEHQAGSRNWQWVIWNALMFQSWQQRWLKGNAATDVDQIMH